jgi:hypothetical protein
MGQDDGNFTLLSPLAPVGCLCLLQFAEWLQISVFLLGADSTAAVGRGNGPKEQSSRKMMRYWGIGASARAAQVASVDASSCRLKTDEMRAVMHTAVVGGVGGCRAGKGATEGRSDVQLRAAVKITFAFDPHLEGMGTALWGRSSV